MRRGGLLFLNDLADGQLQAEVLMVAEPTTIAATAIYLNMIGEDDEVVEDRFAADPLFSRSPSELSWPV